MTLNKQPVICVHSATCDCRPDVLLREQREVDKKWFEAQHALDCQKRVEEMFEDIEAKLKEDNYIVLTGDGIMNQWWYELKSKYLTEKEK